MAKSQVEIANGALIAVGDEVINDFDDANKRASIIKQRYDPVRRALLTDFNWTFAIKRAGPLAPDVATPAFGFSQQFSLPDDLLRFLGLYDRANNTDNDGWYNRQYTGTLRPYKIEGRKLLLGLDSTDSDPDQAFIFYIKNEEDPTKFDGMFDEVFKLALAVDIGYALTNATAQITRVEQRLERRIKRARLINAIQSAPEVITSNEWIDSRWDNRGPFRAGPTAC